MPDSTRQERQGLLLILLVAAALRLAGLNLWPGFSGDEGYETYYGWQTAEYLVFQQNPVRPYLGPWFLWLMAPFVKLLGAGPLAARLPVALLGVATVGLAWAVGRRLGGARAATTAGLLMAVAPFAVLFSRLSLSVATTPFWMLLTPWLALRLVDRPTVGRAALCGAALGAAVAFHPQGLLLGPVCVVIALALPDGRALLRKRGVIAATAAGFAACAWPVWVMILDQVGLGPGIDYSGTWQDEGVRFSLVERLLRAPGQYLDGFVGGRMLHWFAGPASQNPLGEVVARGLAVVAAGLTVWRLRGASTVVRAWALGAATAVLLTVVRSGDFDLGGLTRERYLLAGLTLATPLLGWGLAEVREGQLHLAGKVVAGGLTAWMAFALIAGFFRPLATSGGDAEPSFRAATPDTKVEAARWMGDRLGPDEEGLLLAGDAWSYWPLVALSGDRFPNDFVPDSADECAAILVRTDHRRRWLVDYAGWHWNKAIERCLAKAGRPGLPPALTLPDNEGRPLLLVWELPPGSLSTPATQGTPVTPATPATPGTPAAPATATPAVPAASPTPAPN